MDPERRRANRKMAVELMRENSGHRRTQTVNAIRRIMQDCVNEELLLRSIDEIKAIMETARELLVAFLGEHEFLANIEQFEPHILRKQNEYAEAIQQNYLDIVKACEERIAVVQEEEERIKMKMKRLRSK